MSRFILYRNQAPCCHFAVKGLFVPRLSYRIFNK